MPSRSPCSGPTAVEIPNIPNTYSSVVLRWASVGLRLTPKDPRLGDCGPSVPASLQESINLNKEAACSLGIHISKAVNTQRIGAWFEVVVTTQNRRLRLELLPPSRSGLRLPNGITRNGKDPQFETLVHKAQGGAFLLHLCNRAGSKHRQRRPATANLQPPANKS